MSVLSGLLRRSAVTRRAVRPVWTTGTQFGWVFVFFFNDTATTEIYTLSLHDALPIFQDEQQGGAVVCM